LRWAEVGVLLDHACFAMNLIKMHPSLNLTVIDVVEPTERGKADIADQISTDYVELVLSCVFRQ